MDNLPHENTRSSSGDISKSPSRGNEMFSGSQNFTVSGGTFTTITKNYTTAPSLPSDFRFFPLGDIYLLHEIRVDNTVVHLQHERERVRRVYSARVQGRKSTATVFIYQGNGAEEEWRKDVAIYMSVRHPNIIQMTGTSSSGGIRATLFDDDLIRVEHILDLYRDSHFSTVYIYAFCTTDFDAVHDYCYSVFQRLFVGSDCTNWIRRSTGRLCADLVRPRDTNLSFVLGGSLHGLQGIYALAAPDSDSMVIDALTLKEYHEICTNNLSQDGFLAISTSVCVDLGAIFSFSPGQSLEYPFRIAYLPTSKAYLGRWESTRRTVREVMADGWTRFRCCDVVNSSIRLIPWCKNSDFWLSQANHIFRHLRTVAKFENYVLLNEVYFSITISGATPDASMGFLYLCPEKDFRTGSSSFCWPEFPAYWSEDPSGVDRLTLREATRLGFPHLQFTTDVAGRFWDSSVYAGLRRFHQRKGFNPDSQDVARHLGHPLYQLSGVPSTDSNSRTYCLTDELLQVNDDQDLVNIEHAWVAAGVDHKLPVPEPTSGYEESGTIAFHDDIPISRTFHLLMNVQLGLVFFLAFSAALYE